jgi:putative tributyrin esterase
MFESEEPVSAKGVGRVGPGATRAPEVREYYSKSLGTTQKYRAILPQGVAESDRTYPLLLLLHGFAGDCGNWLQLTRAARYLALYSIVTVCPDRDSGWYTNAAGDGERREDDIMLDLLPHLEAALPLKPYPARAIGGISMGGYGAVKLALKHPRSFCLAVSHSGALDITGRPERHRVFGDPAADAGFRRAESVGWLAEQALCRPAAERPALYLDCGASDALVTASRAFSDHLTYIGYGHVYREMPGHHTWPYFDRAFRTVLPQIARAIGG